jgi:primosomal protein N' (replication factor Y)
VCKDCGQGFRCPRCSVSLTFHRAARRLCCHYCEYQAPVPTVCPACQGDKIQPVGRGTEKIEEEVRALVPAGRVSRMDRDTTRRKGAHERILQGFQGQELDILIGTQMIAKGHDIPEVTLVGVILADVALDLPDFRAAERTFQLLVQVAGRAGRGSWPGRVLIQTFHPDHYCIRTVCTQHYREFYDQEILFRKELHYPPFSRMVNLRLIGPVEEEVQGAAARMGQSARRILAANPSRYRDLEVLGPSQAPLARIRGRYRYHCFLKGNPARLLLAFTREVLSDCRDLISRGKVQLEIDVDPIQLL